jgi:hypothetical protein
VVSSRRWQFASGTKQLAQDAPFQRRQIGRAALAGTVEINLHVMGDSATFDDQDAIGQRHCFSHVVRHEDGGETLVEPDPLRMRCIEIRVSASSAPSGSSNASTRG